MRSELVFGSMTYMSSRYLIANLAARATRKLHKPNTRIQDTTNNVLERFARANPILDTRHAGHLPLCGTQDDIYSFYSVAHRTGTNHRSPPVVSGDDRNL
jgi:hypothetical protein